MKESLLKKLSKHTINTIHPLVISKKTLMMEVTLVMSVSMPLMD
jgi:hypothetical protein